MIKWYDLVAIAVWSVFMWPFVVMILMLNFNGIIPLWVLHELWNMYCARRTEN